MWWQIAAAAIPAVVSATRKRPEAPQFYQVPLKLPEIQPYQQKILDTAFDPQSETYKLASDVLADKIMRSTAQRGLAGSSMAAQLERTAMSDLANKFIENELNRRISALNTVHDQRMREATGSMQMGRARYGAEMDRYRDQLGSEQDLISGIGSAIGAIGGAYNQEQRQLQNQANFDRMMGMQEQIYGITPMTGVPGG